MQEQNRRGTDRRSQWNFEITAQGWRWAVARPSGTEERADTTYGSLKEAGDDAMAHGYGMWTSFERRTGSRRDTED